MKKVKFYLWLAKISLKFSNWIRLSIAVPAINKAKHLNDLTEKESQS